jgi:hypothetical protein
MRRYNWIPTRPLTTAGDERMDQSFEGIVKQAFHEANQTNTNRLEFAAEEGAFAASVVAQCAVVNTADNEYLRLDLLIAALKQHAKISTIELFGPGTTTRFRLVITLEIDDRPHQILYDMQELPHVR